MLSAATQIVFQRLFGTTVYGAYQTVLLYVDVASRGGAGGADKAMLRYVAASRTTRDPEGVRRALGTGLRLCLSLGGALGLLLAFGAGPLTAAFGHRELAPALRLLAPVPVLAGCLWILIQASLPARVTRANFWVRGLLEPSLLLGAGVVVWALGGKARGLAIAHSVAAALTLSAAVVLVIRILRPEERRGILSAPRIPGFVRFSLFLGGGEILNAVLQRADVFIIATLPSSVWMASAFMAPPNTSPAAWQTSVTRSTASWPA